MITNFLKRCFIITTKMPKKNKDFLDLIRAPTGSHI